MRFTVLHLNDDERGDGAFRLRRLDVLTAFDDGAHTLSDPDLLDRSYGAGTTGGSGSTAEPSLASAAARLGGTATVPPDARRATSC
jgi:hypothetical protein